MYLLHCHKVILLISDKGIGIAKKDLDKVIIPFHRGNNTLKIEGSGIGLSLSTKIIKLHNGTLEIKSELKAGTQVSLLIPSIKD